MTTANDIVVNIIDYLQAEMPVYDSNREKIGTVKLFDTDAGYFMVEQSIIARTDLYIPFRLISTIDPSEIFLKQSKDSLVRDYTQPPATTTLIEAHDGRSETAQVLANGYDNRPVVVHRVDVQAVGQQLHTGMDVYDMEGTFLGHLIQYDTAQAVFTVEKGLLTPHDLLIPFSLIQQVYPSDNYLLLTLPQDVLKKDLGRYTSAPANW